MRRTLSFLPSFALLFPLAGIGAAQYRGSSPLRPPQIGALGRPVPSTPRSYYPGYSNFSRRGFYRGGYGIAAYPVFIGGLGGGYYSGYGDYPLGPDPSYAGQGYNTPAPPAPAAPAVVINQYFGDPSGGPRTDPSGDSGVQVYSQQKQPTAAPAPSAEPRTYLIAMKDHSVFSALAYWVEDHTLHYVTPQNTHNQADLSLVDIDFTKKLNQDRNMTLSGTP